MRKSPTQKSKSDPHLGRIPPQPADLASYSKCTRGIGLDLIYRYPSSKDPNVQAAISPVGASSYKGTAGIGFSQSQ